MGCYTYAKQFLNKVKTSGVDWGKIDKTPDNLKNSYLRICRRYELKREYVDGVYDASNKCGHYNKAKKLLESLRIDWNNLGSEARKQFLIGTGLDIEYVEGVADTINHEKKINRYNAKKENNDIVL